MYLNHVSMMIMTTQTARATTPTKVASTSKITALSISKSSQYRISSTTRSQKMMLPMTILFPLWIVSKERLQCLTNRLFIAKMLRAIARSKSKVWAIYAIPLKKYPMNLWKTSFPKRVRKMPATQMPMKMTLLMKIAAHSLGSCTEQTLLAAGQQSFRQYQQNWCPQGHDICGQPVVFSMGIQHLGHLFVRKRKQTKPMTDFRSKPPA